jgi:two-component system, cell cycle sensor histidine kinase PleC
VFGQIVDKKYVEYANDVKQSGDHLLHLINDILYLSKIEAGKYQLEPIHFNLHAAITDAIRIVSLAGQGGSSRIKLSLSDDVGNLYADHRSFRQIMINILSNADKYTPIGGDIKVSASNNQDGSIDIRVADNGIGISEADIQNVLEPFGQSRQDGTLTHEGTGLGLAISAQLMELNGGTLSLTSEVGVGTTVLLHFPDQFTRVEVALE